MVSDMPVGDVVAVVFASAAEEVTFRVAVPLLLVAILSRSFGRSCSLGQVSKLHQAVVGVLSATAFAFLPGHIDQMTSPIYAIPFVAFAALGLMVLHRTGSLLAVMVLHASVNAATFAFYDDAVCLRTFIAASLMGAVLWNAHLRSLPRTPPDAHTAHMTPVAQPVVAAVHRPR